MELPNYVVPLKYCWKLGTALIPKTTMSSYYLQPVYLGLSSNPADSNYVFPKTINLSSLRGLKHQTRKKQNSTISLRKIIH